MGNFPVVSAGECYPETAPLLWSTRPPSALLVACPVRISVVFGGLSRRRAGFDSRTGHHFTLSLIHCASTMRANNLGHVLRPNRHCIDKVISLKKNPQRGNRTTGTLKCHSITLVRMDTLKNSNR